MTQAIQAMLTNQINAISTLIAEQSQPGKSLDILVDEPTATSYGILKIRTICTASLESSWKVKTGRESSTHPYKFSQYEKNFPFMLSLQSEERIRAKVRQTMLDEAKGFATIDPVQLDPTAKLIYTTLTSPDAFTRSQASVELISQLMPKNDEPVTSTRKHLEPLVKRAMNSTLLKHPGLFLSALENEGHNPMARALIQTTVSAKTAEVLKEKDRITRIQEVIKGQLVDNKNKFSNFVTECSGLLQGKMDIQQKARLDKLKCEISLSNGKEIRNVTIGGSAAETEKKRQTAIQTKKNETRFV